MWKIGAIEITPVIELEITGGTRFILPQASRDEILKIGWLQPHFADPDGRLKMAVQSFLVKTPAQRIIVDTGLGNDKQGRGVPRWNNLQTLFLQDIAAHGFAPEAIDAVICTHLHVDHVGWNTRLVDGNWMPTFADARYIWSGEEYAHWHAHRDDPDVAPHYTDSIKPIVDAVRVDFVDSDHRFSPEIRFIPTAGHSPAHMSIAIESEGYSAVLLGDVFHHPCQIAHLDWATPIDIDPLRSTETRRRMCERLAGTQTLVIGGHFTGPSAGYIVRDGDGFRLDPANRSGGLHAAFD
ncbi:MAG: MBL fold metallo-hydrolase [Methylobacteriaceae bacterium]|nr:MBL fold metallo-hydrolase [Methylobacteriaceae bacterium]